MLIKNKIRRILLQGSVKPAGTPFTLGWIAHVRNLNDYRIDRYFTVIDFLKILAHSGRSFVGHPALLRCRDLPVFHAGLHEAGIRIRYAGARKHRSRTLGHKPGGNSHIPCQRGAAAADSTLGTNLPSQKGHPVLTTVKNGKNQGSV